MWTYEKRLQYPVNVKKPNANLAKAVIAQLGGPNGELGASQRYLSQRFSAPYPEVIAVLNDIGTEELAHMEIVSALVYQLTRNLTADQIKGTGFQDYYIDHTTGIFPSSSSGIPWTADYIASSGDVIADLTEDLAAEQKARITYDNILRISDDPDVTDVIEFLRERELVHYQRFGEALRLTTDRLNAKNFYAFNPSFDK